MFWIHSSNAARFVQAYRAIAKAVNLPGTDDPKTDVLLLLQEWLESEESGRWLMILDNADESDTFFNQQALVSSEGDDRMQPSVTLSSYLPQSANGSILIVAQQVPTNGLPSTNPDSRIVA